MMTARDAQTAPAKGLWSPRSLGLIVLAWLILQLGGIWNPGLLDDVDSIYIEIAREMLHRHDFVTPYVDGIRFFDKPPLMYWLAAGSMRVFGEHDWAARLPLALLTLALFVAVYALGLRLFAGVTPTGCLASAEPIGDRGALYSALALATSIGPYLYTRFFIPDILICLWMTLSVHAFLVALDRLPVLPSRIAAPSNFEPAPSNLFPCLAFASTLALNLLTKGLIGLIFPVAFVLLYLALTRQLRLLPRLHPIASAAVFLAIAAPWHILAAMRNPPIPMPSGQGLPAHAGWAWFYLYNEHVARFLGTRVPHDYGQTPVWLFWLYAFLWMMPWASFLPAALAEQVRCLRRKQVFLPTGRRGTPGDDAGVLAGSMRMRDNGQAMSDNGQTVSDNGQTVSDNGQTALTLLLWAGIVLVFFTLSSRQEYYSLPALPALALMIGGALARADSFATGRNRLTEPAGMPYVTPDRAASRATFDLHRWLLLPISTLVALLCATLAVIAPHPAPGTDLATLLANHPELYNVSLGHLSDLRVAAMGLFRGPLATVALGMAILGPASFLLRRASRTYAANLTLAAGMTLVLLAAHEGLARFNPILGSRSLADAILAEQHLHPAQPNAQPDLILLDGEYTSGSTLPFYTRQPAHLVDGRFNTLWFGSFYPDAPPRFESEASLRRLWPGTRRIFLLTYHPQARTETLSPLAPTHTLASSGGKSILVNRP